MPTLRDWCEALLMLAAYLLLLGLCDPVPAAELDGVAGFHQERTMTERYLTEDEQARLLKVLKAAACLDALNRRDDAVIRALIHSGLRIGEFSRISVGDALAALKSGYLFVPKESRKGFSKGVARNHTVYLTQALRRDIEDLLKVRVELREKDCREEDPLVIGRHGEGLTVRNFQLRYKMHARTAGLARSSPHWLRHTRGQNIMRRSTAKDPRGVVQHALGHADIRSSGIYTQTPRELVEATLREVDDAGRRVTKADLRRAWEGRAGA